MIFLKLALIVSLSLATVIAWIPIVAYVFALRRGRSSAGRKVAQSFSASEHGNKQGAAFEQQGAFKQDEAALPEAAVDWPKFCIMTTRRGADPRIAKNIQSFLDLDYPNFAWHLVIDHKDDPSQKVLVTVHGR